MEFSKKTRELSIKNAGTHPGPPDYWWWDYRCWGTLQAAASGLDTGLIEMQDFAEGHPAVQQNWSTEACVTSNNST